MVVSSSNMGQNGRPPPQESGSCRRVDHRRGPDRDPQSGFRLRPPNRKQGPALPRRSVGIRRQAGGMPMREPWLVSDELWELVEPLLPKKRRRFRYPGRLPLEDRRVLSGILFVLHTGIAWEHLPQELGFGSGMTCWRRLRDWQAAGVWSSLHGLLLARLQAAGEIDWSR